MPEVPNLIYRLIYSKYEYISLLRLSYCFYIVRKWRKKGSLGGAGKWEFEVGEQLMPRNLDSEGLMESLSNVSTIFLDRYKQHL